MFFWAIYCLLAWIITLILLKHEEKENVVLRGKIKALGKICDACSKTEEENQKAQAKSEEYCM